MKKVEFVLIFILSVNSLFSQELSDIGKATFNQVKGMKSILPCEVTEGRVLTYCVEGGHKLTYIFNNNVLNGIMHLTAYDSKYSAERDFSKEVSSYKLSTGIEPINNNGSMMFMKPGFAQTVVYSVKQFKDTYYLVYYVFHSIN